MVMGDYCGANKRQGEGTCRRPAGWGTAHVGVGRCKLHGGKTPTQEAGAHRTELEQVARRHLTNPAAEPASGDWVSGTWEPTQTTDGEWVAKCTIGAYGTKTLPVGEYVVWVALGLPVGSGWGTSVAPIIVD